MRPLSPVLAKIAREELNETPERIAEDLIILKEWIKQQPHLKARTNNQLLIAFLRRCRYSLEETKKFIDKYYTHYNLFPEVLGKRFIDERLFELNRFGYHLYFEQPKPDNQTTMVLITPARYQDKIYNVREIVKLSMILIEISAMENDNATVAGCCMILDFTGVDKNVMKQFNTVKNRSMSKKWLTWIRECCPLLTKEMYFICPQGPIYRAFKWKLSTFPLKVNSKLFFLRSKEELFKYIPQELLPAEYGGFNGLITECITYSEDLLMSYRDYFDQDINFGTCEALRSGDVVAYEAEFGLNGSFRKLKFD